MFYWLGVYALVVAVVLAPFLLLYIMAAIGWAVVATMQFLIQAVKNVWPEFSATLKHDSSLKPMSFRGIK
jgi:hypothetical protein